MSGTSAVGNALSGINNGLRKSNEASAELASKRVAESKDPVDTGKALLKHKEGVLEVQINARVIKAVDEGLGTLLDDLA